MIFVTPAPSAAAHFVLGDLTVVITVHPGHHAVHGEGGFITGYAATGIAVQKLESTDHGLAGVLSPKALELFQGQFTVAVGVMFREVFFR